MPSSKLPHLQNNEKAVFLNVPRIKKQFICQTTMTQSCLKQAQTEWRSFTR